MVDELSLEEQARGEQEIHALLLPAGEEYLLLPNSIVAEIVEYRPPRLLPGAPPWLQGLMPWRGVEIPLLCPERMWRETPVEGGGSGKVVVLHALGDQLADRFFAVRLGGIPSLVRVQRDDMQTDETRERPDRGEFPVRLEVLLGGQQRALIPDLDALEHLTARTLGGAAASREP